MVESHHSSEIPQNNERSLQSLIRGISLAMGRRFSLLLVRCNYRCLQERVMERLRHECPIAMRELVLPQSAQTLYTAIKTEFGDEQIPALNILGLEHVVNLNDLLLATNQVREEFRKSFKFPLVLWVTDEVLTTMVRLAPDFYSWAAPISFQLSSAELTELLRQQSNQLFAKVLYPDDRQLIDSSGGGDRQQHSLRRQEVESALQDLHNDSHVLEPDLEASLQFALGQDDYANDRIEGAIEKYQQSLAFWQQQADRLERKGVLLLHLGLCSLRQAELERTQNYSHWEEAERYFRQCLEAFAAANRPDLRAKFIGYRGDAIKRLEQWDELQSLVQESLELHQVYRHSVELARDYSFLAEIRLNHSNNALEASQYAQQALQALAEASDDRQQHRGQYLLLLAQAQQQLDRSEEAIATLLQARQDSHPHQDPQLYIQILETLRKLYFEQKKYREAFQFKQEQQSIESQYGFRAFIGAGCLRSQRQLKKVTEGVRETVAQEIAVSGRQQDVDRLLERIERNDHQLIILHGQLGVGKSSLIQAGLISSLQQKSFQARDALPIFLRVYTNWTVQLSQQLTKQIQAKQKHQPGVPSSVTEILKQLRRSEELNLLTILIFDQFEEFFFVCQDRTERQSFFEFLSICLDIPFVKIILSLREDYLYCLLEWEQYGKLDSIKNDILSKECRYKLGNFSPQDAKAIIQGLTKSSPLALEPPLIEKLVQDLAKDLSEIRPIELQVVGAELQEEKIITLEKYQQLGENAKAKLVQNYLEGVIGDCGKENENAARLVLY